jgi:hypothetical protein
MAFVNDRIPLSNAIAEIDKAESNKCNKYPNPEGYIG